MTPCWVASVLTTTPTTDSSSPPHQSLSINPPSSSTPAKASQPKAMEEFQEADVLWPDGDHGDDTVPEKRSSPQRRAGWKESALVGIPKARFGASRSWAPRWACHDSDGNSEDGDDNDCGGSERIPPHIIVARRTADKMASSMCIGFGRTLKGRDLRHFRNSVLRMTGFLER